MNKQFEAGATYKIADSAFTPTASTRRMGISNVGDIFICERIEETAAWIGNSLVALQCELEQGYVVKVLEAPQIDSQSDEEETGLTLQGQIEIAEKALVGTGMVIVPEETVLTVIGALHDLMGKADE